MKIVTSTLLAASLALPLFHPANVHATVFKYINGDNTTVNSDWSLSQGGNTFPAVTNGSPSKPFIVTNDSYRGTESIGYSVPTDSSGNKERIENKVCLYNDANALNFGNSRYIGYAVKLAYPDGGFSNSALITQAWQGSPWGPPVALKFTKSSTNPYTLRLCIRNMQTGPDSATPDLTVWTGSMSSGVWHTVVIYITPRYNTNGEVKLWIDGTRVVDWIGGIGYDPSQTYLNSADGKYYGVENGLDVKCGIYQPDANVAHTLYFDEIRFTNTYADADPLEH